MEKQLYYFLIHAKDDEGPFYQNYYPFGKSLDDAINYTALFLAEADYTEVEIVEHILITVDDLPSDVVQEDDFEGFIQPVKYGYDDAE